MDNVNIRRAQLIDALGPILGRWAEIDRLSDAEAEYDSAWQDKHRPTYETIIIKTLGGDVIHVEWDSDVRLLGEWVLITDPFPATYVQEVLEADGSWLRDSYANQPASPTVKKTTKRANMNEVQIRARDITSVYAFHDRYGGPQ